LAAAQVKNIDSKDACKTVGTTTDGVSYDFPLPAVGEESTIDLSNHKVVAE